MFRGHQSPPETEHSPYPGECSRGNLEGETLANAGDEEVVSDSAVPSDEGSCAGRSHGNRRPSL